MNIKQKIQYCLDNNIQIRLYKTKYQTEVYNEICLSTSFLPKSAKIKERIFCVQHDITSTPTCKHCHTAPVDFLGPSTGYRDYCSVGCSSNSDQKQSTIRATNLEKYGTNTPAESTKVKQRYFTTLENKYGKGIRSTQQLANVREKTKSTNLLKYGHDTYTSSDEFKIKKQQTIYQKYGVKNINQSHIPTEVLLLLEDKEWLDHQNRQQQKTLTMLSDELNVSISTISAYFKKHDLVPTYYTAISQPEQELLSFITSITSNVIHQDRSIIKPKELDIVLPDYKIAIEFCGLYWHSDIHPRISKSYHLDKLVSCTEKGYRLITIFEDEWIHKTNIVKTRLLHFLGKTVNSIYARNCDVVLVTQKQKQHFFDQYHIQGNGRGSITYGLSTENQLVAVMTFIDHNNGCYELNRYATNGNIIGGFSKLLSYFKRQHKWHSIISFADRRWSNGAIYHSNGFVLTNTSLPSYDYILGNKRMHRRNFMKGLLHKKLPNYDPNLTEFENCDNHNLLRIWNCGQLKFVLYNTKHIHQ